MANLYQILGVESSATAAQIKDAYRRAAMRWHPDRNKDRVSEAERRFKEIGAAYAILSDPEKRQQYDNQLRQTQEESEDSGFDAGAAAELFMREMVEMATAMAATGYNKDVLLGALLSQGVPESIASELAGKVIAARARAQASAADAQRAKTRDMEAERRRQAEQSEAEAFEACQNKQGREDHAAGRNQKTGRWILGFIFSLICITVFVSRNNDSVTSNGAGVGQLPRHSRTTGDGKEASQRVAGQLAVAARKANVRSGPGLKFSVVLLLDRGELVSLTKKPAAGSFVEIDLGNGRKGWISNEVLIDAAAARALSETTAERYAESRPARLESMVSESDLSGFLRTLSVDSPMNFNPSADSLVATIKALAPATAALQYPADRDSLRYWMLEGRWLNDNGGAPMEVVMSLLAAVYADPSDSGALVALGMAAMKAGFFGPAFDRVVRALTIAAPEATNTWVLLAASAAHRKQPEIARAALDLALRYSRDVKVTRSFIAKIAAESPIPLVAAAFGAANAMPDGRTSKVTVAPPLAATGSDPQCSSLSRHHESFDQQMSTLVRMISRAAESPRYTADQAIFVERLCNGELSAAQELIDEGKVKHDFAEQARRVLNASASPFRSRTVSSIS